MAVVDILKSLRMRCCMDATNPAAACPPGNTATAAGFDFRAIRATGGFAGLPEGAAWVVTRKTEASVRVSPQSVGMKQPGRSCLTMHTTPALRTRNPPSYVRVSHPADAPRCVLCQLTTKRYQGFAGLFPKAAA
jgi:hypothetical protein